jgi:hypothetical protein
MTRQAAARVRDARLARDLYESGHTIHYVAAILGRSYGGTRDLLLAAGTVLRSQGARAPREAA